jgi:hypothetical protein
MRYAHWPLVLMAALGLCHSAQAGIFFSKKPKADPAETVPALIMQLKTDKDDGKRQSAAEELRNFDPNSFPEIMTVLIDALTKDTATGVRSEAATSIAKLRPINQQAGFALEQAASNDPSMRVRMVARQSLWQYHLVGYRSGKPADGPSLNPLGIGKSHTSAKPSAHPESAEPPLANPQISPAPQRQSYTPRLLTPPPSNGADGPSLK